MRILFISGLTGFASGGVITEMCRLIGGMRNGGAEVAFVIDRLPAPLSDVRHFPIKYPPTKEVGTDIKSAIDDFKPDCVHLVGGGLSVLRPLNEMRLAIPWHFTAHNVPPFEQISGWFFGHNRLYYLMRNARALPGTLMWKRMLQTGTFARVIAHSQTVAGHLVEYGCPADKVAMIPLGCEMPAAAALTAPSPFPDDAFPKILTVAGYAHHKGIHDYIDAVAQLIPTLPKLAYRIIGNSRNQQYTLFLQSKIDRLKLGGHVQLLRSASDEIKQAALFQSDLYVQPSHEEGFCLAFSEAVMISQRLIGCRTGEIAGLAADAPSIKIVAPMDVPAFVSATKTLLTREAGNDILSRGERLVDKFSWTKYLDQHTALYSSR